MHIEKKKINNYIHFHAVSSTVPKFLSTTVPYIADCIGSEVYYLIIDTSIAISVPRFINRINSGVAELSLLPPFGRFVYVARLSGLTNTPYYIEDYTYSS